VPGHGDAGLSGRARECPQATAASTVSSCRKLPARRLCRPAHARQLSQRRSRTRRVAQRELARMAGDTRGCVPAACRSCRCGLGAHRQLQHCWARKHTRCAARCHPPPHLPQLVRPRNHPRGVSCSCAARPQRPAPALTHRFRQLLLQPPEKVRHRALRCTNRTPDGTVIWHVMRGSRGCLGGVGGRGGYKWWWWIQWTWPRHACCSSSVVCAPRHVPHTLASRVCASGTSLVCARNVHMHSPTATAGPTTHTPWLCGCAAPARPPQQRA
jgi:hypothetical protein